MTHQPHTARSAELGSEDVHPENHRDAGRIMPEGQVLLSDLDHSDLSTLVGRARALVSLATGCEALSRDGTVEISRIEHSKALALLGALDDALERIDSIVDGARPQGNYMRSYREARCAALGLEFFVTPDGRQVVLSSRISTMDREGGPEVEFIHRDDSDDRLEDWLADRETAAA